MYSDINDDGQITSQEVLQENRPTHPQAAQSFTCPPDMYPAAQESLMCPFGMTWDGDFEFPTNQDEVNKYQYNGKEIQDDEFLAIAGDPSSGYSLGLYDYGARWYDPAIARFTSTDRFAENFADKSPYHYASNNPIKYIDINGDSTYVMIWATANGQIGHAGIAVDNYDSDGNADGTYTYYDLWPGGEGAGKSNFDQDVEAYYSGSGEGQIIGSKEELLNFDVNGSEPHSADGIVQFATGEIEDNAVKEALQGFTESNPNYNGVSCNCSDFAAQGVEAATGQQINATEQIGKYNSTTPNALYKAASSVPGARVIRDPGKKVNNDFITGASGGGVRAKVGRKRVN